MARKLAGWRPGCRTEPRADIAGTFKTEFDTTIPCTLNPLGVKGVCELCTIDATPAVMNAVIDALTHACFGRAAEEIGMPATPEQVWQMLRARQPRAVTVARGWRVLRLVCA